MSPTESGKCPVRQIRERWQVKKSWAKAQERVHSKVVDASFVRLLGEITPE